MTRQALDCVAARAALPLAAPDVVRQVPCGQGPERHEGRLAVKLLPSQQSGGRARTRPRASVPTSARASPRPRPPPRAYRAPPRRHHSVSTPSTGLSASTDEPSRPPARPGLPRAPRTEAPRRNGMRSCSRIARRCGDPTRARSAAPVERSPGFARSPDSSAAAWRPLPDPSVVTVRLGLLTRLQLPEPRDANPLITQQPQPSRHAPSGSRRPVLLPSPYGESRTGRSRRSQTSLSGRPASR